MGINMKRIIYLLAVSCFLLISCHDDDRFSVENVVGNNTSIVGMWLREAGKEQMVYAFFKRTLKGVHHWVSRKHLQRYVDSSAFRYNTKHLSECERFDVLLQNIGHRLRYLQLKNVAA